MRPTMTRGISLAMQRTMLVMRRGRWSIEELALQRSVTYEGTRKMLERMRRLGVAESRGRGASGRWSLTPGGVCIMRGLRLIHGCTEGGEE